MFKKLFASLLQKTEPARRNVKVAALVGVIGGVFSAIVKFGWEVPFPPRTPERNATNPPQTMLEWFGMSPEQSHTTVSFNLNDNLPIYSFIIHFSFAIIFALFYCIVAEYFPGIKLWQGACLLYTSPQLTFAWLILKILLLMLKKGPPVKSSLKVRRCLAVTLGLLKKLLVSSPRTDGCAPVMLQLFAMAS